MRGIPLFSVHFATVAVTYKSTNRHEPNLIGTCQTINS